MQVAIDFIRHIGKGFDWFIIPVDLVILDHEIEAEILIIFWRLFLAAGEIWCML